MKQNDLAKSRFEANRLKALEKEEFIKLTEDGSLTPSMTIYYVDSTETYGRIRGRGSRYTMNKDKDVGLFFSFNPDPDDTDNPAFLVLMETLFLDKTYGERWFVCDPLLD
jgi:hypothetical protein